MRGWRLRSNCMSLCESVCMCELANSSINFPFAVVSCFSHLCSQLRDGDRRECRVLHSSDCRLHAHCRYARVSCRPRARHRRVIHHLRHHTHKVQWRHRTRNGEQCCIPDLLLSHVFSVAGPRYAPWSHLPPGAARHFRPAATAEATRWMGDILRSDRERHKRYSGRRTKGKDDTRQTTNLTMSRSRDPTRTCINCSAIANN